MSADQHRLKKIHREAVVLAEVKKVLGFPVPPSAASPVAPVVTTSAGLVSRVASDTAPTSPEAAAAARELYDSYGLSMTAVNAYLLRYLRSKHLSVDDALAKLRRRRVFERTLPTISVTPTTVAALRSGALHLLGNDLEGRPILYINISAFTLPTLELDEAQRLLVILLEFMQAQCLFKNNEDEAEARQQRANEKEGSPTAAAAAQSVQEAEREATRHLQQFTLLINEEGAQWGTHETFLGNSGTFFSMFPKYYPLMLGNVLVLGASFEIRMAIKACVGNSPDDVRDAVRMIDRPDLSRFMHPHTIPVELGGQKQVAGSAMNFSEAVLRHWFTLTSQMEEESVYSPSSATSANGAAAAAAAGQGGSDRRRANDSDEERERRAQYQRPLYVPPPPLGTTQRLISRHRQMLELEHLSGLQVNPPSSLSGKPATRSAGASGGMRGRYNLPPLIAAAAGDSGAALPLPVMGRKDARGSGTAGRSRNEEVTDDGVCSVLSGLDDDQFSDRDHDGDDDERKHARSPSTGTSTPHAGMLSHQMFTAASISGASEAETDVNNRSDRRAFSLNGSPGSFTQDALAHLSTHPDAAVAALQRERRRREQAEQALQFRDLGVTLNLRNASTIEKELASLHQDLNVLVAEVLLKAEAAGKRQKAPATLNQLLDLTLTAFEGATNTPSTVPAMSFAEPAQREPASSGCCSFM